MSTAQRIRPLPSGCRRVLCSTACQALKKHCSAARDGLSTGIWVRSTLTTLHAHRHRRVQRNVRQDLIRIREGIGKSNGIFFCPPGRTRALRDVLGAHWPGRSRTKRPRPRHLTRNPPGHRLSARFMAPHQARPASGAASARSPGYRLPSRLLLKISARRHPGRCPRIQPQVLELEDPLYHGPLQVGRNDLELARPPQFGQCFRSISKRSFSEASAKLQRSFSED